MKTITPRLQPTATVTAEAVRHSEQFVAMLAELGTSVAVCFDGYTERHPANQRNVPKLLATSVGAAEETVRPLYIPGQRWLFVPITGDLAQGCGNVMAVLRRIGLLRFARVFLSEGSRALVTWWPVLGDRLEFSVSTDLRPRAGLAAFPSPATDSEPRPANAGNIATNCFTKLLPRPLLHLVPSKPSKWLGSLTKRWNTSAIIVLSLLLVMKFYCLGSVLSLCLDLHSSGGGGTLTEDQFQTKVLRGVEALTERSAQLQGEVNRLKGVCNELSLKVRNSNQVSRGQRTLEPGKVSEETARFFGAVAILKGLKQGTISGDGFEGIIKDVMGVETRTALTSSDIPLPVGYSGEVAELVGMYGTARRYGTVLPLGTGVVKLPRLKTDTTFGLISGSGTVTEKSPQTEWVTFTAEKFGGLIRLPSEMSEDSVVDIGQFLARYAARQIAYCEDWNFWRSTGAGSGLNGTAEGLTKSVATNSKTTTSTGLGSPSEFTLSHFRTLRGVPDASALRQGAYYLHPSFEALLATFNTSGNKPYNPNAQIQGTGAQPFMVGPTLDGFPIRWVDVLPVYTTSDALSTVHVLFGDVSFNYLGLRGDMRFDTSMEAGFGTDEILVRALERMTVGLMATGAVGGLITAAA